MCGDGKPADASVTGKERGARLITVPLTLDPSLLLYIQLRSHRLLQERTRRATIGLRWRRRRRLEARRRLDLDFRVPVDAGTRRDQVPDDDVLLEAQEVVLGPANGGIGQYPGGLLERRGRNERLRGQ